MQPSPSATETAAWVAGRTPTEQERRIGWTRTGLGLLILAILLQWIPVIEFLGLMLGALGIVDLLRGCGAFGQRHRLLLGAAMILFVSAEVTAFGLDNEFTYWLSVARYGSGGAAAGAVALASYAGLAEGSAVIAIVVAVSYALLVFDLEDRRGRGLLLVGVASQAVVSVVVCAAVLLPFIQRTVPPAFATSPPDAAALATADAEIRGFSPLRLLDALAAMVFAWAYLRAYRRVNRGGAHAPGPGPA